MWAVTIDAASDVVGKVKAISGPVGRLRSVVAAAGPRGAATIAWTTLAEDVKRRTSTSSIGVARRAAGGQFTAPVALGATHDYLNGVALAADEDGTVTAAWSPQHFGSDRHGGGAGGLRVDDPPVGLPSAPRSTIAMPPFMFRCVAPVPVS